MADVSSMDFVGPIGGGLGVAYALGCASGWKFAMRLMKAEITRIERSCEKAENEARGRISRLEEKVASLTDMLLHGMERQAAQVRSSSIEMGIIKEGKTT